MIEGGEVFYQSCEEYYWQGKIIQQWRMAVIKDKSFDRKQEQVSEVSWQKEAIEFRLEWGDQLFG